jgi:hypothetical protein
MDSPVMEASSMAPVPETTWPSTGTFAPFLTRTISPILTCPAGFPVARHRARRGIRGDGDQFGQCRAGLVQGRSFQRVADGEQERDRRGLPEVADDDRADRRHRHQQVDADDLGDQRANRLDHDPVAGDHGAAIMKTSPRVKASLA